MRNINVLTIHSDAERGGAAVVAKYIHDSFNLNKELLVDSYFISPNKSNINDRSYLNLNVSKLEFLINVFLFRIGLGEGYINRKKWQKFLLLSSSNIDLFHLHNAHGYYLPESILEKLLKKPIVWTLHDFWLFTGRCASPISCSGYLQNCDPCPLLNKYPSIWIDKTKEMFEQKKKIILNSKIQFVVPSNYMLQEALKMGISKENITVVYNPIAFSFEESKKISREYARKKLDLKTTDYIGIFISNKLDNPEKGVNFLISALNKLKYIKNWHFIFIGHCSSLLKTKITNLLGDRASIVGFINNRDKINLYLKASNVFVNPTITESFGLINVEAILSGCDVISSDLPVLKEVLGNLGTFFSRDNENTLIELLKEKFLSKSNIIDLNSEIINHLNEKFSLKNILNKYRLCYDNALNMH